jgi:hypothetical protein
MPKDTLALLDQYISAEEPRKWAKLSSTITYRRLVLLTLREILLELQALNGREMAGDGETETLGVR